MNQLRLMALVLLYLLSCSHVMAQINPTPKFAVTPTGHGSYDAGRAVTYDASGNMYVAGYFSGEFNADNTTATNTYYLKAVGNKDIYVAKYNASGNLVWAFGAGGANDDEAAAISVDAAGNVYIAGYTNGNNTTTFDANPAAATNNITRQSITVSNDMFVAKYDGTQLPSSASFYQWAFITGDVGDDKVNAMALDPAGKLYVGGYITGTTSTMIDADPGTGTYNVTGATATNNTDLFMACYDVTQTLNSGSFLSWAHTAGNIGQDNVNDIKLSGGYLYATGQVNISNAATVDMDPSSNTATVTGTTASQTVEGFVAKYDASVASGNASFYKWAFLFGGNNSQYGYKLDVDANGFVYLAGICNYGSSVDMDPGTANVTITGTYANSYGDVILAKYDGNVNPGDPSFCKWAFVLGNEYEETPCAMAVDAIGNLYFSGKGYGTQDVNPATAVNNISSPGLTSSMYSFMVKYKSDQLPTDAAFYQWSFVSGNTLSSGSVACHGMAIDAVNNRLYVVGEAGGPTFDVDPSVNVKKIVSSSATDIYGVVYDISLTPTSTSFYKTSMQAGNTATYCNVNKIIKDANGNIYTFGSFNGQVYLGNNVTITSNGYTDIYIAKYNSAGVPQWAFNLGGTILNADGTGQIAIDANNNLYVALSLACLTTDSLDLDPSSNNYYLKGKSTNISNNYGDIYVMKYDANFAPSSTSFFKWAFMMGNASYDYSTDLKLDADGYMYLAGYTYASLSAGTDVNPGAGSHTIYGHYNSDQATYFLAKYDTRFLPADADFFKWAFRLRLENGSIRSIEPDNMGNIYLGGTAQISTTTGVDMDPGAAVATMNSANTTVSYDVYIAKYNGQLTPTDPGFFQWAFAVGGTGTDIPNSVQLGKDSCIVVSAASQGLNTTSGDWDPSSKQFLITGKSIVNSNDIVVAKYDTRFAPADTSFFKWAFSMGTTAGFNESAFMTLDTANNVYLFGTVDGNTANSFDIDPSSNLYNVAGATGTISNDLFLAKYDGNLYPTHSAFFKAAGTFGSTTAEYMNTGIFNNGRLYIGATFTAANMDIDPGTTSFLVTSPYLGTQQGLLFAAYKFPTEWTGAVSIDWNTAGNWNDEVPAVGESAIIPSTGIINEPTVSGNYSIGSLSVDTTRTLTIGSGYTLTVTGTLKNSATITGVGRVALNGTTAQSITGNGVISNLQLNNSAGASIASGSMVNLTGIYTPTSGLLTTNSGLTLKSDVNNTARIATGAAGGGYITGNVTVERYNTARRAYRFYAHPFTGAIALSQLTDDIDITGSGGATNGFTPTQNNAASAFWFNQAAANNTTGGVNAGWTAYTSANTSSWARFTPALIFVRGAKGEGLNGSAYTPSASTFEASGWVNAGNQSTNITKGANSNFVACGNPFPSPINMQNISRSAGVGANYYIWDANQGTSGAYVTNPWTLSYILPMYGAFITTTTTNANFTIPESAKTDNGVVLHKGTAPKNWVELTISDSVNSWDRLLISLDDNSMAVLDTLDGTKILNPGLDFFTLTRDSVELAVDVRPYTDSSEILLGLRAYKSYNKYVIRTGMFEIPSYAKLYLHDKYLNKVEELKAGSEYWFDVTADTNTQGNKRFVINMSGKPAPPPSAIANTKQQPQIQLVPNPASKNVQVSFDKVDGIVQLRVLNITGQTILTKSCNGSNGSIILPVQNFTSGLYIVEVKAANATFTQKLIKE